MLVWLSLMILDLAFLLRQWCKLKSTLSGTESRVDFKQREIWWCSVGVNLGEESFGKGSLFTRPVLVFRKFTTNSFLGLPITGQEKQGSWYAEIGMHGKKSWVMLNQARIFDRKRLVDRIGTLDDQEFNFVKERFRELFCP